METTTGLRYFAAIAIPHRFDPILWQGDEDELISIAQGENEAKGYSVETLESLLAMFGDEEEIPAKALEIVKRDGKVVEVNHEFFSLQDAPNKLDWAKETFGNDYYACHWFEADSEESAYAQARECAENYKGHQDIMVKGLFSREPAGNMVLFSFPVIGYDSDQKPHVYRNASDLAWIKQDDTLMVTEDGVYVRQVDCESWDDEESLNLTLAELDDDDKEEYQELLDLLKNE